MALYGSGTLKNMMMLDPPLYLWDISVSRSSSKLLFPVWTDLCWRKSCARRLAGSRGWTELQGVECSSGRSAVEPSLTRRVRKSQMAPGGTRHSAVEIRPSVTDGASYCSDVTSVSVEARQPVHSWHPQHQHPLLTIRLLHGQNGLQLNCSPAARLCLTPPFWQTSTLVNIRHLTGAFHRDPSWDLLCSVVLSKSTGAATKNGFLYQFWLFSGLIL